MQCRSNLIARNYALEIDENIIELIFYVITHIVTSFRFISTGESIRYGSSAIKSIMGNSVSNVQVSAFTL